MSGNRSRRKGQAGERQLFALLREHLGDDSIQRNLQQTREGGGDCAVLVGGMLIEVKRWAKAARLHEAILQAEAASDLARSQISGTAPIPVVVYRLDGDRWRFLVDCDLQDFCLLVREEVFTNDD